MWVDLVIYELIGTHNQHCEIQTTCQHMKPNGALRINMSTYQALLHNINVMSVYETITHIVNSYVNIRNLVAQHNLVASNNVHCKTAFWHMKT